MIWSELNTVITSKQSFLISAHESLDGDNVASQLAMRWYLSSLGKDVVVFDKDPVPPKFAFLANTQTITGTKPERTFDIVMILDSSNPDRLGWEKPLSLAPESINIDHHRDNSRFATYNYVVDNAAATAFLIWQFFTEMKIDFPLDVAEALYVGVLTDTGGFRFSNTTPEVFAMAADLVSRGVKPNPIYRRIYESFSRPGQLLHARIWQSLAFHMNGKLCTVEMPLSLIDKLGAVYSDSEGMSDITVMGQGVEVGIFIKYKENETHFSLRSSGAIDVGLIAQNIPGGGGHSKAAGCTMQQPLAQAKAFLFKLIEQELARIAA